MEVPRAALLHVTVAATVLFATSAAQAPVLRLPFETFTLPNGLTVILSPDKTTPTVAVTSGTRSARRTKPSAGPASRTCSSTSCSPVPATCPTALHDKLTEGVGGSNNGTTNNDRTTYYETVPSNYLESALWLEADRMGYLLDALDLAKLNAQRDIVKNERRQSVDNQPYGRARDPGARDLSRRPSIFLGRDRQHGPICPPRRKRTSRTSSVSTTRRTTRISRSSGTSTRRRPRRG